VAGDPALLATTIVAVYAKTSGGLKVTEIVQVCWTLKVAGQLFVWVKVGLTGLTVIDVMLTGADPSLVKMALCVLVDPTGTLPRLSEAGVSPRDRTSPVPVRAILCVGLPGSLSLIMTDPFRVPDVVGVKVTEMAHCCPAFRTVGHVLDCA
jgi:hypothetical protein